jgi:cell surface protein SprA
VKYYTYRPLDLFNYRQMKMFVHGDATWATLPRRPQAFYRFGLDSLNYYEYRGPIYPGWDARNEILIKFSELTAIKQLRDSVNHVVTKIARIIDGDTVMYRVVGNPSLTQVRYLAAGVTNRDIQPLYGQVWYNELRLTEVDDSPGWAYRFDTQLKLADLATVSFNYSKVDPNFHTLEQRFGSRQTGTNWALNVSMQFEKFFPNDWVGTSFPFSYSRAVSLIRPKYLPNSDVQVREAADL